MDKKNGSVYTEGKITCILRIENKNMVDIAASDTETNIVIWFESDDGYCTPRYSFANAPKWLRDLYNQANH